MSRFDETRASLNTADAYQYPSYRQDVGSIHKYDPYEEVPMAGSNHSRSGPPNSAPEISMAHKEQATADSVEVSQDTQESTIWQIHWRAPTLIVGLLIVGIGLALGHHLYYQSLSGTRVGSDTRQEWALRFGTAFAFLTQSSLVASAGAAYTQRVWVTVKKRPLSLNTLDSVFSLQSSIWSFFSWQVFSKAKLLYLLGICIWCIPISSLITPATVSVHTGIDTNIRTATVPYPDYSADMSTNWVNLEGAGRLDGPTPEVTRIVATMLTSMAVMTFPAPFPNSSYSLNFYGPAFQCQNLSDAVIGSNLDTGDAASLQAAWNLTMEDQIPKSEYGTLYVGARATLESIEDVFMMNHFFVNTNGVGQYGRNYSCHLWNMSYTVDFGFQNGVQSTEIQKLEPVAPLEIDSGEMFNTYSPGDMQYRAMFRALTNALTAVVRWGSTGSLLGGDTDIVTSALAACPEMKKSSGFSDVWLDSSLCRAGSIPGAIEDLSRNLTLSILSSALLANETTAEVTVHTSAALYSYNMRNLLLAYAIAVCATAACAAVGLHALVTNGYSADTMFSSILLTTRNSDLDELARSHCLGQRPLAKGVGNARLRFGVAHSQTSDIAADGSHACFGLADDVRELKRGEPIW